MTVGWSEMVTNAPQQSTISPVRRLKAERWFTYSMGWLLVRSSTAVNEFHTAVDPEPAATSPSTVVVALALTPVTTLSCFALK